MASIKGYRCDQCRKESEKLSGWYSLEVHGSPSKSYHLCDLNCLVRWAIARSGAMHYERGLEEGEATARALPES